jgi:hypothetical protein
MTSSIKSTLAPFKASRRGGQQCRLVVAPLEQPDTMEGHRGDHVGPGDQLGAAARQPGAIGRRALGPVGVLEAQ